ncbi:MAG: hypothetical protein EU544_04860 [Promethearchaeota archaeon]|nr:MAG: hypothetical protein EU544_04860 [Candidatus Lokiarchaeota archaeon]
MFELIAFQIVQTVFDYAFNVLLLALIFKYVLKKECAIRKILIVGAFIEVFHIISSFMWYFFVLYAIAGFILTILFYFVFPYFAVHLGFVKRENREEGLTSVESLKLYVLSVPFSVIASVLLASLIFNLIGIHNFFALS